ncbi:MAG TPA: choice-of-anchor Q domain-containing protein [Anaerolineales bacterium]|nr:choice-of-anchor Q domain-containing protein [Anaerolineales bacterium]
MSSSASALLPRALLAALVPLLVACSRAPTTDLNVTKFDDSNDGQCTSRDCSLREAVLAANATEQAETILLPPGTYTLTLAGGGEEAAASGDLDLVGEVTVTAAGEADPASVVVDASQLGDRAFHLLSGSATVKGLTVLGGEAEAGGAIRVDAASSLSLLQANIQGGQATGAGGGGAVYSEGSLTLEGATITGALSVTRGGALMNIGTASLVDSTVRDNAAYQSGGGIANLGTLTITGGLIQLNYAREKDYPLPNPAGEGGGLSNLGSLDLVNVNVTDNHASSRGGGIFSTGTLTMQGGRIDYDEAVSGGDLTLDGNAQASLSDVVLVGYAKAEGSAIFVASTARAVLTRLIASGRTEGDGGVIYNAGELTVSDSLIENGVGDHGGAIFNSGTATIENSTIQVSKARVEGGGIYSSGSIRLMGSTVEQNEAVTGGGLYLSGSATLENCTVSGNTSDTQGGGIWTQAGTIQVVHCTITDNAAVEGSGVYLGADLQLANSILALNPGSTDCAGPGTAIGRGNLQGDASCALPLTGNLAGVDPLLDRLRPNGDRPATHALLPGSPAIDAADALLCLRTDESGASRPQGDGCDSGAVEAANTGEATLVPVGTAGYTPTPGEASAAGLSPAACRSRPSAGARTLTTITEGQTVPVVGRTDDSAWLQVVPIGRVTCWVAVDGVTLQGSLERVPVVTP